MKKVRLLGLSKMDYGELKFSLAGEMFIKFQEWYDKGKLLSIKACKGKQ